MHVKEVLLQHVVLAEKGISAGMVLAAREGGIWYERLSMSVIVRAWKGVFKANLGNP